MSNDPYIKHINILNKIIDVEHSKHLSPQTC